MISKLARDSFFRSFVRSILAYIQDPEDWGNEVDYVIAKIVPKPYIETFKKTLIKRNPNVSTVSEYFDLIGLRNRPQLEKAVKSLYEGMAAPKSPVKEPVKSLEPHPLNVEDKIKQHKERIRKLEDEIMQLEEELSILQGNPHDIINEIRTNRAPTPRTACLEVINKFLDTLG